MTSQILACFILVLLDKSIHRTNVFFNRCCQNIVGYFVYLFTTIKCCITLSMFFQCWNNKLHDFNHISALKLTVWSWLCWFTPPLSLFSHVQHVSGEEMWHELTHSMCVCVLFSKDVPAVSMPGVTYTLSSVSLSVMMFASLALSCW